MKNKPNFHADIDVIPSVFRMTELGTVQDVVNPLDLNKDIYFKKFIKALIFYLILKI